MQPRITLCSVCHSQMPVGQSYCQNCGSTLCPHCRELLPQRSRYCPKCGLLGISEEQAPIRKSVPSAVSSRPQSIPIPRAPVATPPPVAQTAAHQQSWGPSFVQQQRNCPKCGASIDHELGRCSGCGLLYGVKHRAMQSPAVPAMPVPHPTASWPQSPMGQPQPAAQAMHQYNNSRPSLPVPRFGQHPNHLPSSMAPQGGILMPIPSMAPATAGAAPAGVPIAPRPYRYQSVPSASAGQSIPAPRNRGLPMVLTTLVILIVCFLIGGGIYYFINRPGTTVTPNAIENSVLSQDVSVQSTSETGAAITWKTDRPASGQVIVRDSSGAVVAETTSQETSDTSHSAEITGLKPNTTYHYTIVSTDDAGNETTSEGKLQTSAAVTADKTPPTILGVNVSNVTESSAIITWTTNEPATSQVKFEKNEKIGSTTPVDKNLTTNHSIRLAKLDSGATYSCSVISRDAAGNEAVSATKQTFKTLTPIPVGTQVGNRAPPFALKDLNGRDVKLGDFRGKPVMINFWAVCVAPARMNCLSYKLFSKNGLVKE